MSATDYIGTDISCPNCNGTRTACVDSRPVNRMRRRRRRCMSCNHRFTTYEAVSIDTVLSNDVGMQVISLLDRMHAEIEATANGFLEILGVDPARRQHLTIMLRRSQAQKDKEPAGA